MQVWQEDEQISNEMLLEGRVDFAVKADYSRGSDMEKMVFAIIDQIAASAKTAQMHVAACDRRRTPFKRADAAERIGNMKKRKLLVLDIDGTLTNTQKDITPKTLEAILKIEQMGHAVALASGRPTGGMRRYIGELELAKYGNYAISYNGACVTNMQTNEIVVKTYCRITLRRGCSITPANTIWACAFTTETRSSAAHAWIVIWSGKPCSTVLTA